MMLLMETIYHSKNKAKKDRLDFQLSNRISATNLAHLQTWQMKHIYFATIKDPFDSNIINWMLNLAYK